MRSALTVFVHVGFPGSLKFNLHGKWLSDRTMVYAYLLRGVDLAFVWFNKPNAHARIRYRVQLFRAWVFAGQDHSSQV